MAFNTSFVSSESFTLPDEIFQKLRSSAFVTGRTPSKEETRGAIEGALNVGAERASERARLSQQFALQQEGLDIQRQRNEAQQAFQFEQVKLAKSGQRAQAIAGAGALAGLVLFSPIFSSTTGKATTVAGKIFKFFFP